MAVPLLFQGLNMAIAQTFLFTHKFTQIHRFTHTLYRKSDLCIPINEIARPYSQFLLHLLHVSVSNLYIPNIGLPIWLQQNRQTILGIYKARRCMNVEIGRHNIIVLFSK